MYWECSYGLNLIQVPYYLCTQLWEKLEESIQLSNSIFEFKQNIQNIDLSES